MNFKIKKIDVYFLHLGQPMYALGKANKFLSTLVFTCSKTFSLV